MQPGRARRGDARFDEFHVRNSVDLILLRGRSSSRSHAWNFYNRTACDPIGLRDGTVRAPPRRRRIRLGGTSYRLREMEKTSASIACRKIVPRPYRNRIAGVRPLFSLLSCKNRCLNRTALSVRLCSLLVQGDDCLRRAAITSRCSWSRFSLAAYRARARSPAGPLSSSSAAA
jgi:hypothetical protein